jgi:protein-S-isoprenylcysteine O-methyltransferase Ste14
LELLLKSENGRAWLWVLVQCVLLAALIILPPGPAFAFLTSLLPLAYLLEGAGLFLVAAAALNLGGSLTSLPSPKPGAALKTGGLYRCMRHPIYTGVLVWAFGFALAAPGLWRLLIYGLLCLFISRKARYEEALLQERFPEYEEYAARTPRFFPRWNANQVTH